ncbi:Endothelin-converting enzyme 1 [Bulinus truncatus]|nr:Endothelin-converting enzyme 1 [Bulinus truncatus]
MRKFISDLGGWPVLGGDTWSKDVDILSLLVKQFHHNSKSLIDHGVAADDKNSEVNIIQLDQADLGMPSPDYFISDTSKLQVYKGFALDVTKLLNAVDPAVAERDIQDMIDFEVKLAKLTIPKSQRRDNEEMYNKMTIKDFSKMVPENCFSFVIKSILMVAEKGWMLLPLYDFNRKTGKWWFRSEEFNFSHFYFNHIFYISNSMEEISQQLDETVLQIFDVLERLYESQDKLSQLMKNGFLGISRARCSMGVKNVSADQIVHANLLASLSVNVEGNVLKSHSDLHCFKIDSSEELFKVIQNTEKLNNKPDKDSSLSPSSELTTGPRKRHTEKSTKSSDEQKQEKTKLVDKTESLPEDDESPKVITNSLSLFGVLVPQALRTSQKDFIESVRTCVELANLKHCLHLLQIKYRDLCKRKNLQS